MNDITSRQEVIDMVKGWNLNQHIMNEEDALDDVKALQSVEPTVAVKPDWKDAVNLIFESGNEYKAILSILNRLEIRDNKRAYTMNVLKAEKSAIWRICIGNAPNKDKIRDILSLMEGDESK